MHPVTQYDSSSLQVESVEQGGGRLGRQPLSRLHLYEIHHLQREVRPIQTRCPHDLKQTRDRFTTWWCGEDIQNVFLCVPVHCCCQCL